MTRTASSASAAQAIYADIEYFGRYGFNKAHAADYAVITIQTAYLKAMYPVEYMAALLLVERDKTEKVVNFIQECRRMGIHVLPPDVNHSGLDFAIQDLPADAEQETLPKDPTLAYNFSVVEGAAIRFGMAAVKNVGVGPVQAILDARAQGGPFLNLEDLCDRVDLRQVNKRPLECLIKVGALDRFGQHGKRDQAEIRHQLLDVIDQCIARSAATHNARESGQLSMFDLLSGANGNAHPEQFPIRLPDQEAPAQAKRSNRERFQWEKELLGVFVSSHPVQQLNVDLSRFTTCPCAELNQGHDGRNVTLAGMLASIRTTVTKKGDKMAFAQLEDMQGQCEAVFFPEVYKACKENLEEERVVLVKGKAQTRNGRTSILVDTLQTAVEFGREKSDAHERDSVTAPPPFTPASIANGSDAHFMSPPDDILDDEPPMNLTEPSFADELADGSPAEPGDDAANDEAGPPAETALYSETPLFTSGMVPENKAEADGTLPPAAHEGQEPANRDSVKPDAGEEPTQGGADADDPAANAQAPVANWKAQHQEKGEDPSGAAQPVPPNSCHVLRITFSRSGRFDRDKYRLREIFDAVRDPKGRDQFVVVMETNGSRHQLTFPNEYCTVSDRLLHELRNHFKVEVAVESEAKVR